MHTAQTIQGLAAQIADMTLETPASYEMAQQIGAEMMQAIEGVVSALDRARFEKTWGEPLPLESPAIIDRALDQDDFAAAPEGPAMHPTFGLLTKQFMAPQVRR